MLPLSVHANPGLSLTVLTDKKTYYPREIVKVNGTFQNNSSPISDALVAIQVNNPYRPTVFRTVTTGTVPESTPTVRVKNISLLTSEFGSPTDTLHIPIPFLAQLNAYFLVTLKSSKWVNVTCTLTVFDSNMVCLGSVLPFIPKPLPPGIYNTTVPLPIYEWTSTGTATVCANLYYPKMPSLGGYPLSPENSTTFQIVRGTGTTSGGAEATTLQTTGTNGTYEFNFRLSPEASVGTYTVYSSSYYRQSLNVKGTTFSVDPLYSNPKAVFYWTPLHPYVNCTVTFDASSSLPDGGTIVNYTWNFGDATSLVTENDPVTNHVYTAAGTYTVTLNVTDSEGKWGAASQPVEALAGYGPTASFTYSPLEPFVNGIITFNASSSTPGWNETANPPIVSYTWNFGDGNVTTVTDSVITHIYTTAGNYTVTLNVADTMGWWNTTSQTLRVYPTELDLTVITDEPPHGHSYYYFQMDEVQIRGNLTFDGKPVADGLVALEIDNPNNSPVVFRTLKTGTDPISGAAVNITHLFLCNETTGEPLPGNSVKKGTTQAYFRATVKNIGNETLTLQLILNFYQNLYPLGWIGGGTSSLNPGGTYTLIGPFLFPSWISVGNVTVYASVFSAFPRLGGYPYCEEKSSTFKIVDPSDPPSQTTTSTTNPSSNTNGTYNFVFKMPVNAPYEGFIQGTYTIHVSTYYGLGPVTNSTTITVKLPGDANGDGWVDGVDLVMYLAPAFNSKEGDANWNPDCDFNGDGWVDGIDLVVYLAPFYGKKAA